MKSSRLPLFRVRNDRIYNLTHFLQDIGCICNIPYSMHHFSIANPISYLITDYSVELVGLVWL